MQLKEAIAQLRKEEKRKFDQTVDLLISLKGMDMRKDSVNVVTTIPHKFKEKQVCAFLENKSTVVKTITKPEFDKFKDKKELKNLVSEYDFFIASAKLMPSVATTFGKALGPAGKMPSPQLGVLMQETPEAIKSMLERISKSIKIRTKEAAIKLPVGKESMSDQQIEDNIKAIYNDIVNALPGKKENVKKVMVKTTMGAPVKVEM